MNLILKPNRSAKLVVNLMRSHVRRALAGHQKKKFWNRSQSVVAGLNRPANPIGVAVFLNCGFLRDGAVYTLIMRRLIERNWHATSLHDDLPMGAPADQILGQLDGMLLRKSPTKYHLNGTPPGAPKQHVWEIDLDAGHCRADGIEFYPVVMGKLRRLFKAYDLDFSRPEIKHATDEIIESADAALTICYFLRDKFAARGLPVRILGAEHLYVPAGIFMMFCAEQKLALGMEFVDFSGAYTHYFTAGEYLDRHSYAVQNITRRNCISRHIVHRNAFDRWLAQGQDGDAALKAAYVIIKKSWIGDEKHPMGAHRLINRIRAHRAAGGVVACAFGHVGFDLGVPNDTGDAHADMIDWLNDTIKSLNNSDVLLLIKPHPTEKRYKPNRKPNQLLAELITTPLSNNVVLMDALWFNTFEMIDLIDVGLVWRSNVALELAICGIPPIVAGRETAYRDAVDLIYPTNRAEYHNLLNGLNALSINEEQGKRCALYLKYLSDETFINLPYIHHPGVSEKEGFRYVVPALEWEKAALQRFLAAGDPAIERICDEIVR